MNSDYLLLMTFTFSVMMLIIQRAEPKYRRTVAYTMLIFGGGAVVFFLSRRGVVGEAVLGFIFALVINFLFWVLIGRYNPVKSSDETIQVLGMDD